jgi:predicted dehydrogenase
MSDMSDRKPKVGVVGMRAIGNTHAEVYHGDPLAELAVVWDVDRARADAAERWGVPAFYTPGEMLRHAELDCVSVATGASETAVATSSR